MMPVNMDITKDKCHTKDKITDLGSYLYYSRKLSEIISVQNLIIFYIQNKSVRKS